MTNFNTPLSAPQLAKLRSGQYAGDYLLTLCKNTVIFSGQLSAPTTGLSSWVSISYSTHTGNYTDIEPDEAILFSATNDIKTAQNNRSRVRYDPVAGACATANTIYVGESSQDWAAGTYFWVIYTFDVTVKKSFFDANGVESIDYNLPYQGDPPIAPTLRTAYVGDCDPATGKMRVAFDVSDAYASQAGQTVTGFAWTFKAGTDTVVSGSKTTAVVTIDFAPGEQWGKLVLTDSAGVSWTRRFYIHAHDANNPYDTGFEKLIISGSLPQGWTLRAPAFTGVDNVLSKTFGVVSRGTELYGYTSYHLDTNNIAFVGWVQREDANLTPDPTYALLSDTAFQMNGFTAMLARLAGQEIGVGFSAPLTAGVWGYNASASPWRAIIHYWAYYTTALNLAGFDADLKDDTYLYPSVAMTGQNSLDIPTSVAKAINAGLFFAPDGRIRLDIDAAHWGSTRRAADTPIATFTATDGLVTGYANDLAGYGLVDADGLYYNATNGQVGAFKVRAPGIAMGEAQNRGGLTQQILAATANADTARNELIQRANDELEALNITEVLTWKFPDGYHFLIPSRGQTYAFIIAATLTGPNGVARIVYDGTERFLCESVNESLLGNGALDITATFRRLSRIGDSTGLDMTPGPDNNASDPDLAIPELELPAFDWQLPELTWPDDGSGTALIPDPEVGQAVIGNGQELIVHTADKAYFIRKLWTIKQMRVTDITPADLGSYQIKAICVDPFYTRNAIPVYLLASDGVNSVVWHTDNAAIAAPTWTKGANLSGVYNVLRSTNTANNILIYSPGVVAATATPTYSAGGSGPATLHVGDTFNLVLSAWTPGGPPPDYNYNAQMNVSPCCTFRLVSFNGLTERPGCGDASHPVNAYTPCGGSLIANTTCTYSFPSNLTISEYGINSVTPGSVTLQVVSIDSASGNAAVCLSSTAGATWAAPETVGATPGIVGGFDVQRAGTVSYAASSGKVRKASTLGGAYSDYYAPTGGAQAACVILPYFTYAGVLQTSTANPDVIVGLTAPDGSSRTLLWIEGGATPGTVHDLTPVASFLFGNPNAITISYSHHLACFGTVSGVKKLYRTANKGVAWTLVKTLTNPQFIRGQRNDNRAAVSGANKGLCYLADVNLWVSTDWVHTGPYIRTMPDNPILGLEPIF